MTKIQTRDLGYKSTPTHLSKRVRNSRGRSRYGCLTCKVRRVKCDEARPRCLLCTRRGHLCEYGAQPEPAEWERNVHTFNSLPRDSASSAGPSTPCSGANFHPRRPSSVVRAELPARRQEATLQVPVGISPFSSAQDSRLLNHFKSSTSKTLLPFYQGQAPVWELEVIQLAFSNEFLMHALLMTSALHLYRANGSESLWLQSLFHLQETLKMFSPILLRPTLIEANVDAVLATSILLIIHMAGTPPSSHNCISIISLIQGAHLVIQQTQRHPSSIFRRLYRKSTPELSLAGYGPTTDLVRMMITTRASTTLSTSQGSSPASFTDYGSRSPPNGSREAEKEDNDKKADKVCLKAVESISDILSAADIGMPFPPGKIVETILQRASPFYLSLVEAKHPKALVILAYYHGAIAASLAHHSSSFATGADGGDGGSRSVEEREFWWLEQMPSYKVQEIAAELGQDWARWMRWPLESVRLGKGQEDWYSMGQVLGNVKGGDLSRGTAPV